MKKITLKFTVIAIIALSIWSCSTKKDTFLNRTMHATTTKYNVLYNGKVAYEAQKKQIDDAYIDDFYNILPIEPLKIEEVLKLTKPNSAPSPTSNDAQGFARAEEKAVKAIQKHSMHIKGKERNSQIDEAYLLLGKSRYYDQRFVPALETFKYMLEKYPKSNLFNDVRVWEAKTLIRLGNEDEAIYKLDEYLTKVKALPYKTRVDAHTALAMAFTKQDSVQQTINHLNKALFYAKKVGKKIKKNDDTIESIDTLADFALQFKNRIKNQTTRNAFVLGQLYRQEQKMDSSNMMFNEISKNKKAPYRYQIYAQIERAKNYNKEVDNAEAMLASLEKLAKNRDNRPYLDGIFFQLGNINLVNKKVSKAVAYFEKSILTKQAKDIQKSFAYEALGNIYFDKANFPNAGKYYDSVLNITKNKNTKRIKKLTRKRKSLDEVIRLENITAKNDSILNLVAMSKEDQTNFFTKYIKELKQKDEEARIVAENAEKGNTGFGESSSKLSTKGNVFYFYNAQTVGFGKQEFQKIWGNRELADNWRLSNKKAVKEENNKEENSELVIDDTKKYDIQEYLSRIPTETKVLDSINTYRNKAYYNLGLIYKEQFNKHELATNRLEKLLVQQPKEKYILPSYYHLYKSFENFDLPKSEYYKNKITSDFSDSKYAQLINNPNATSEEFDSENTPEKLYEKVYKNYVDKKYQETFTQCNTYIKQLDETPILPKFELLKAHAIAQLNGKEPYKKALGFVIENYPTTLEGKRAAEILAYLNGEKPKEEKKKEKVDKRKETSKQKIKKGIKNKKFPSKEEMMEKIKQNKLKQGKKG